MEQLFYPEAINKREGMRRKSSASNLLSTLGTSSTSGRSRQGSDPIENIALNDNDGMDLLKDTIVRRIKSFKLMRMAYEGLVYFFLLFLPLKGFLGNYTGLILFCYPGRTWKITWMTTKWRRGAYIPVCLPV